MKYRLLFLLSLVSRIHRDGRKGICKGATAMLGFALWLAGTAHCVFGQSAVEPLNTIVHVHLDPAGDIFVGPTEYLEASPGGGILFVALKRQPDNGHLNAPDLIQFQICVDANSANQFLQNVLANTPDAFLIASGVGNYGFPLSAIAKSLEQFGGQVDLEQQTSGPIPFIFIGNGGMNKGGALQRGYSTFPVDGYLAPDSNGNYTFIQPDYIRYDITTDGTIKIGSVTYDVASSYKPGCTGDASASFHVVIVNRENLLNAGVNNTYCTAQTNSEFSRLAGDISKVAGNNESALVFIASNGHPIPANWNFGTDGDARVYPVAQQIAMLGGYFETMVYLTQHDTYSLVGAAPPPSYVPAPWRRAKESSSVYPDHPSGELHGVLARGRGNWYSPLNADPTGIANLGFYEILGQTPVAFPHPNPTSSAEVEAFQSIANTLCGSNNCNPRNFYPDTNIDIGNWKSTVQGLTDPSTGKSCTNPPSTSFCAVQAQLIQEFEYVSNIRNFNQNLTTLYLASGTNSINEMLSTYNTIQANLPAPPSPSEPIPNLARSFVNFFLGVGSLIPEVGPMFGAADTLFNFGASLTTDQNGNRTIDLTSTVATLEQNAVNHFNAGLTNEGTQFDLIYQDWGKISALGTALSGAGPGSAWYWNGNTTTGQILTAMAPAIQRSYYRCLMAAVYAIGRFVPSCWGATSPCDEVSPMDLWQQVQTYYTAYNVPNPSSAYQTFPWPPYAPYTYPTDTTDPFEVPSNPAYTQGHNALLADGAWLGISSQNTPEYTNGGAYNPASDTILSTLFTPVSEGGLGVYRPAFFEGWPFPRVQCDVSYDQYGDPGNGCDWSAAAPASEAVQAPLTSVSVAALTSTSNVKGASRIESAVEDQIDVPLAIHNNGTKEILSIQINDVSLRTVAGDGQAVLASPGLPFQIGDIKPGAFSTVNLHIMVPPGVRKLVVTEELTADSGELEPYRFSFGQALFPGKRQ